jgi:hypothetical protein
MTSRFVQRAEGSASSARTLAVARVLLLALVGAVPARAQSEPIALVWNAPADCASARDVLARVRKLTKSARLPERQLSAEASVTAGERGQFHLKLVLRAGGLVGERNIDGRSCDDLAGASAVVLALLLSSAEPLSGQDLDGGEAPLDAAAAAQAVGASADHDAAARSAASTPASAETKTARAPDPAESDEPRAQRRWHGLLQLPLAALGVGPVPRYSLGLSLGAGARFERWSFLAEGSFWLAQRLTSPDQPDSEANLQRIEAAIRSCRAFLFGQFELAPCARVAVQHLWARGTGAHVAPQTATATWLALGLGVQARYHIVQWFSIFGGVDAHVQTARPRVSIDGVGELGQLWPAALTITLGTEWIL